MEQRAERLRGASDQAVLPISLVAISAGQGDLVGSASIVATTLTHKHLTPWLSSVFVPPTQRGRGIASKLALAAISEADRLGFKKIFLFTPKSEALYARLGWETFEQTATNDVPVCLMSRSTRRAEARWADRFGPRKSPAEQGFLLSADNYRPAGAGVRVEPLGEGLMSVLPDGFSPLLAPAAALPALLDVPLPGLVPMALPVVVPVAGDPVVPLVAAPPVLELPLAEPVPDCASAYVLVRASAVASPNAASFMIAPCFCCITANEVRQHYVPAGRSQFVAVPLKIPGVRNCHTPVENGK